MAPPKVAQHRRPGHTHSKPNRPTAPTPARPAPSKPAPSPPPAPTPPTHMRPVWVGVDKKYIPKRPPARRGQAAADDPVWMDILIRNSNLRFTGAYVTGAPVPGHAPEEFLHSTRDEERGWMRNLTVLAAQGWGFAFFYVGHSMTKQALPQGVDGRARGTLHGRHLRMTLSARGAAFAGAVVYVDNEDSETDDITKSPGLVAYYQAMFTEMSRPDPDLAAFRPGLYGRGKAAHVLLANWPAMFVWDIKLDTSGDAKRVPPFDVTVDPMFIDVNGVPTQFPPTPNLRAVEIRPYPLSAELKADATFTWPVSRQFRFYEGPAAKPANLPAGGSATAARLSAWRQESTWDFDASFVRNPAFPVAVPRIGAVGNGVVAAVLVGAFQDRPPGATAPSPVVPRMRVERVSGGPRQTIGGEIAADAPIQVSLSQGRSIAYTVLANGELAESPQDQAGHWPDFTSIGAGDAPLRAIRAVSVVVRGATDKQLFFAGTDDRIHVKRNTGGGWAASVHATADVVLHPFSSLAAEVRGQDVLNVVFIDRQGRLASLNWARWYPSWPDFRIETLESAPSCLSGTALATVSPRPDDLLVFAVGADSRLRFCTFVHGTGWSAVQPAGPKESKVGAHSRLAAYAASDSQVLVAALTDRGSLAIYTFNRAGTAWTLARRDVLADPPGAPAGAPAANASQAFQPADGCRINPFGDIALVAAPAQAGTVALCAGVLDGAPRLLLRNTAGNGQWVAVR